MANLDLNDFNARVKRIQDPRNNSYYDQEMGMHVPKQTSQAEIKKVVKRSKFSLTRLLFSVGIGAGAVMGAQAIRLRYLGMTETGQGSLFADLLLAAFLVLFMSALVRHRKVMLRGAQVVGAIAMLLGGHNLMWFYPDKLAMIYTPEYVAQVRAETEPMSVAIPEALRNLNTSTTDS